MTATNHTATGALIAAFLPNPLVAVPAALVSHLVLDMLPHYSGKEAHTDRKFFYVLGGDAITASTLLLLIFVAQPSHWLLMIICGVVAASPDLLWLPYWLAELKGQTRMPSRLYGFLGRIQRYERPWGWIPETVYFLGILYLLVPALSR